MMRQFWTTHELRKLTECAEAGMTMREAAVQLGKPFFSTTTAARRYQISFRGWKGHSGLARGSATNAKQISESAD